MHGHDGLLDLFDVTHVNEGIGERTGATMLVAVYYALRTSSLQPCAALSECLFFFETMPQPCVARDGSAVALSSVPESCEPRSKRKVRLGLEVLPVSCA